MTLQEMLDYTREYLDDASVDLVDGDNDKLWSDRFLVVQFNEAQRILARRAWVIVEYGISPAGVVTLVTGKALYSLHPSTLRIFDATPTTQAAPLGRTEDAYLRDPNPTGADALEIGESAALAGDALTGVPIAVASDAGSRTLRVSPTPTPDENGTRVLLKVARMPVVFLTLNDTNAEPETPREWDAELCHFAAGRALVLPNVDADQKVEGRRLLAAFDETVRQARQERQRAEMGSHRWGFSSSTAVLDRG